jgi:hypothetical protein
LADGDSTAFRLSRAAFAAPERAADGTAYPARPFPFAEQPATPGEAKAIAACSRPLWTGSGGCGWRVPRGEVHGEGQSGLTVIAVRPWCAAQVDFGG